MRVLSIESSGRVASVCVTEGGRTLAYAGQNNGLTHSVALMPLIEDMLRNGGVSRDTIDCIAVANGPGSFTGVRIGVAAAKGFAWARGIEICTVSTLAGLAHNAALCGSNICAVMDARRGQVYNALFSVENAIPVRLTADRALSVSELAEKLKMDGGPHILVGDGAELCYNEIRDVCTGVALAPEQARWPDARGVAMAAAIFIEKGKTVPAEDAAPLYLRPSQAEREAMERTTLNG